MKMSNKKTKIRINNKITMMNNKSSNKKTV